MYSWLVFIHLVGLVLFAIAHGVSVYAAFTVRADRDPRMVASHLAGSKIAVGPMYVGLLLLGIGGLGAAWSAGILLAPWVIASYVVLLVVLGTMYAVATPYYIRIRELVGDGATVDQGELDAALASRRPEVLASVGAVGLVLLVYLMVIKPG
jgi:hypothetical protein